MRREVSGTPVQPATVGGADEQRSAAPLNDCVSSMAVLSMNTAGKPSLPDQCPRLAHGEAASAARLVGQWFKTKPCPPTKKVLYGKELRPPNRFLLRVYQAYHL